LDGMGTLGTRGKHGINAFPQTIGTKRQVPILGPQINHGGGFSKRGTAEKRSRGLYLKSFKEGWVGFIIRNKEGGKKPGGIWRSCAVGMGFAGVGEQKKGRKVRIQNEGPRDGCGGAGGGGGGSNGKNPIFQAGTARPLGGDSRLASKGFLRFY